MKILSETREARSQAKLHAVILIMGDLNAKVRRGREGDLVGNFRLESKTREETCGCRK